MNLPDQTVPQFLEEVTDAVASLQATRIGGLIYFPIISGTGEPLAVLGSNNMGIMVNESAEKCILGWGTFQLLFGVLLSYYKHMATIENAVLQIEGEVSVETAEALFKNLMTTIKDFMLEILKEEIQDIDNEKWDEMLDEMWDEFLDKQEWTEEFDLTQELLRFKLKKVNEKWKFNLDVDFDQIDPI